MYPVKQDLLKTNRSKKPLKAVGMVVHSTASPGGTDDAHVKYFNTHPERKASAHVFIDWDSITQTVPLTEIAWHAGGTANKRFIGVELCEPSGKDSKRFAEVYNRAVWYFAYIFVNVLKVKTVTKNNLMSHAEVSDKWRETTHVDPIAYFKKYGKTVDGFRKDVQYAINKGVK
jgi:N-acetylmuramoyl-L-alanine amidase